MLYTTIQDVIDYEVIPALGEYANDYDAEGIARACWEYDEKAGGFVERPDSNFWDGIAEFDTTEE